MLRRNFSGGREVDPQWASLAERTRRAAGFEVSNVETKFLRGERGGSAVGFSGREDETGGGF
jgi:hypothetical protein